MRKIGLFPILLIFFVGVSCNNEATETSENDFVFDSTDLTNEKQVDRDSLKTTNSSIKKEEDADDEINDDPEYVKKANPLYWKDAGITDSVGFKLFLKRLKNWVKNDEREKISSVILYPMVHPGISSKEVFLAQYDIYFNAKVKKALENQKLSRVNRSNQRVMLTTGELWFKQTNDGFKITFINN